MSFDIRDYIFIVENIVPTNLIDAVLNEYVNTNEWNQTITNGGAQPDVRNCTNIYISHQDVLNINPDARKQIDDELFKCASKAITMYKEKYPYTFIDQDSGYELLRYETNQFYLTHVDSFKEIPRAVSCSFALNENYGGGEFSFFDRQIKIKLPKGAALMFPSNFLYPHEVLPVTNGTRYSIVTWFV